MLQNLSPVAVPWPPALARAWPPRRARGLLLVLYAVSALAAPASAFEEKEPELPAFSWAEPEVPARARLTDLPTVDDRAGPWACNDMTLLDEITCVFAGRVLPLASDAPATNLERAEVFGDALCATLARETADPRLTDKVRALCVGRLDLATAVCAGGETALLDDTGHFGAEHARCYASFLLLVREVRAVGQTWAPCCACLVDAGCSPSFRVCADDVARCQSPLRDGTRRCEPQRCDSTCRAADLLAPRPSSSPSRTSSENE